MIARAATVALWLALPGVALAVQITGEPIRWMPGSAPKLHRKSIRRAGT